jgi:hypothetical protein
MPGLSLEKHETIVVAKGEERRSGSSESTGDRNILSD